MNLGQGPMPVISKTPMLVRRASRRFLTGRYAKLVPALALEIEARVNMCLDTRGRRFWPSLVTCRPASPRRRGGLAKFGHSCALARPGLTDPGAASTFGVEPPCGFESMTQDPAPRPQRLRMVAQGWSRRRALTELSARPRRWGPRPRAMRTWPVAFLPRRRFTLAPERTKLAGLQRSVDFPDAGRRRPPAWRRTGTSATEPRGSKLASRCAARRRVLLGAQDRSGRCACPSSGRAAVLFPGPEESGPPGDGCSTRRRHRSGPTHSWGRAVSGTDELGDGPGHGSGLAERGESSPEGGIRSRRSATGSRG